MRFWAIILIFLVNSCSSTAIINVKLRKAKRNDNVLGSSHVYLSERVSNTGPYRLFAAAQELDTFVVLLAGRELLYR
jgi:hypothetical protein